MALTMTARIGELIDETSWPRRFELLAERPELIDRAIGAWCEKQGHAFLGAVIGRAAMTSLEQAEAEFPLGNRLVEAGAAWQAEGGATGSSPGEPLGDVVAEALTRARAEDALWLARLAAETLIAVSEGQLKPLDSALSDLLLNALSVAERVDADDVQTVLRLTNAPPEAVRQELPELPDLATAARTVQEWLSHRVRSGLDPVLVDDTVELLALASHDADGAMTIHQLVVRMRQAIDELSELATVDHSPAPAGLLGRIARPIVDRRRGWGHAKANSLIQECQQLFAATQSAWLLRVWIQLARAIVDAEIPGSEELLPIQYLQLTDVLLRATHAEILEPDVLSEAREFLEAAERHWPDTRINRILQTVSPSIHEQVHKRLTGGVDRAMHSHVLGVLTWTMYNTGQGGPELLAESLGHLESAYAGSLEGHPFRAATANSLGIALTTPAPPYELASIERGISLLREAHAMSNLDDGSRIVSSGSLAAGLTTWSDQLGVGALEEGLELLDDVLRWMPPGAVGRSLLLVRRGEALAKAAATGLRPLDVLLAALSDTREAVAMIDPERAERAVGLAFLANRTAEAIGAGLIEGEELAEPLETLGTAIEIIPDGNPSKSFAVAGLARLLATGVAYGHLDGSSLERAELLQRTVLVDLARNDHPELAFVRSGLAQLLAAGAYRGLGTDRLVEAVDLARASIDDIDPEHLRRPYLVAALAGIIGDAVEAEAVPEATIDEAVHHTTEVLGSLPRDHPARSQLLYAAANALGRAVDLDRQDEGQLQLALEYQGEIASRPQLDIFSRVQVVTNLGPWLAAHRRGLADDAEIRSATHRGIDELWDALRRQSPTGGQRRELLTRSSAALSIAPWLATRAGDTAWAVEICEATRNHLWQLTAALPSDDDRRSRIPPDLVARYRDAALALERSVVLREEDIGGVRGPAEAQLQLNEVTDELRRIDGFESFGSMPEFDDIVNLVPGDTALVYLVAGPKEGAALVAQNRGAPRLVPLPQAGHEAALARARKLYDLPEGRTGRGLSDLSMRSRPLAGQGVAAWLWASTIGPLLDDLAEHDDGVAEVILVPTGPFTLLPLHSAGSVSDGWFDHPDRPGCRLLPTAGLLAPVATDDADGAALIVAYDARRSLMFQEADVAVASHLGPSGDGAGADRPTRPLDVLRVLDEAAWATLTCHGATDPLDGAALELEGGLLTTTHLRRLTRRQRDLAILNACSTAQTALRFPDEHLGLANALLQSGFEGVCATSWDVRDDAGFACVARFLQLARDDPTERPHRLLRRARIWLRETSNDELYSWALDLDEDLGLPPEVVSHFVPRPTANQTLFEDPAEWAAFGYVGR